MNYGRYQVEKELGKGSMGIVYQAHDPNLDLTVALKVLRHDRVVSDAFVRRFLVEARALGRLDNPNIVRVYNVDEDSGTVYIAMEFIEGESLDDVMSRKRFRPEEIVELGATVAETLDYAHKKGIVHRDIKPSNILVRGDGRLKITDFGIAHMEDRSTPAQTQAGEILGTPAYMSPEQVLGRPVEGRSDLFSLGIILYELCTGSRPFKGENLAVIFHAITSDEPPPVDRVNTEIPPELSRTIMRSLRKSPQERYETGMAMAAALRSSMKVKAPGEEPRSFLPAFLKKHLLPVVLGGVVAVGGLAGLTYYLIGSKEKAPGVSAPSFPDMTRSLEEMGRKGTLDVKSGPGGPQISAESAPDRALPATVEPPIAIRGSRPAEKTGKKGQAEGKSASAVTGPAIESRPKESRPEKVETSARKYSIQNLSTWGGKPWSGHIVRGVVAEGACAISGMNAEQSQLIALQKARAASIENATGGHASPSTLVRDDAVAVELIRTYFRGFIVRESVEWLPIAQLRVSADRPPIPEYRVRVKTDVAIPERLSSPTGLKAKLNSKMFRKGERARLEITTQKDSRVAVFNLTADDRVVMVFPNRYEKGNTTSAGKLFRFPAEGSITKIELEPIPGHARDAEAFFVVAVGKEEEVDFFSGFGGGNPLTFTSFFERYVAIAPRADEVILPYVVEGNE